MATAKGKPASITRAVEDECTRVRAIMKHYQDTADLSQQVAVEWMQRLVERSERAVESGNAALCAAYLAELRRIVS